MVVKLEYRRHKRKKEERRRTWCRDERRQLRSGILFLIEEGLNIRGVIAAPALIEKEKAGVAKKKEE